MKKINYLRLVRIILAVVVSLSVTLLLLDFTGVLHPILDWSARIQFLPSLMALNFGVVVALLLITWLFGRIYCSVICPLGVLQDLLAHWSPKALKRKYNYSPAKNWLRYGVFVLFIGVLVGGLGSMVSLLAPYSAFGRIVTNLFAPIYRWGNNLLAMWAERVDSYAFYEVDVWLKSLPTLIIAAVTLLLLAVLAWRGGRTYCNTICPVGTLLGIISKSSWFKPTIDTDKCTKCGLCERKCKASCIDAKNGVIDHSRCVACMNCISACYKGGVQYTHAKASKVKATCEQAVPVADQAKAEEGLSRRAFLGISAVAVASAAVKAQEKTVDGGLAIIEERKIPARRVSITPPGSWSARHFYQHCTGCGLCISACPNNVLRPSTEIDRLMQPEMSYERGHCRPECTRCSDICPAGAIKPLTVEEKSAVKIGRAVWLKDNCVVLTDHVSCGNCARHCPAGAISIVPTDANDPKSLKIPVVNDERCIGCGACEDLCPSRPFAAIYVEGIEEHREI